MARTSTRIALQAKGGDFITIEQAQAYAPSIAAQVAHEKMSGRYAHLNTLDTINAFAEAGFGMKSVQAVKARSTDRFGFEKHLIRFAPLSAPAWNDRIEIVNVNAHDGTSADLLALGVFRMACANGMIAGTQFDAERIKHVGDAQAKLGEAIARMAGKFGDMNAVVDNWKTITLGAHEYQEFSERAAALLFDEEEDKEGASRKLYGSPTSLLRPERSEDTGRDLWTVFNVAQEHIMSGRYHTLSQNVRGQRSIRRGRPIASITRTVKTNQQLWDIAASYAA